MKKAKSAKHWIRSLDRVHLRVHLRSFHFSLDSPVAMRLMVTIQVAVVRSERPRSLVRTVARLAKMAKPGPTAVKAATQKHANCHVRRTSHTPSSIPRSSHGHSSSSQSTPAGLTAALIARLALDSPNKVSKGPCEGACRVRRERISSSRITWGGGRSGIRMKRPPKNCSKKSVAARHAKARSVPPSAMVALIAHAMPTEPKPPKAIPTEHASAGASGSQNCRCTMALR